MQPLIPLTATAGGQDALGLVFLALVVVLAAAKLGGHVAVRLGQPAVLGEILAGVALGNLPHLGLGALAFIREDPHVAFLAELGVVLLLFQVGLESTVRDMLRVGPSATLAAALGVVVPFFLGWGAAAAILPSASPYVHVFIGATLTATSVGITARLLKDLGRSQTAEARIILGAAVVDDVLGLVVLATVSGLLAAAEGGGRLQVGGIALIVGKAAGFLAGAVFLGVLLSARLLRVASRLRGKGVLLAAGLITCFLFAWSAAAIGLAPIVGAFAAGLVLEPAHYKDFVSRGEHQLEELVDPVAAFLVPVFFVLMGFKVDAGAFARADVVLLALALTLAAVAGKQACALGVLGPGVDRLSVGIGMIPRGEVGLIFAGIGQRLVLHGKPVLDRATFSAVVLMVVLTTMITPPALKWSLARRRTPEPVSTGS